MGLFDKNPKEPLICSYKVHDKAVVCQACGHAKFEARDILLNTTAMTFLGLDWANRSATALICTNCTRIEWYYNKPKLLSN